MEAGGAPLTRGTAVLAAGAQFTVIDGRLGVSGAQPVEVMRLALQHALVG